VEAILVRAVRAIVGWLVITLFAHAVAESMPRRRLPKFARKMLRKHLDLTVTGVLKILILYFLFQKAPGKPLVTAIATLFAIEILLGPGRKWSVERKVKKSLRKFFRNIDRLQKVPRRSSPSVRPVAGFKEPRKTSYRCGARTKKGGRCGQRVAVPGIRCYRHQ
jgi:hypothetical protein